MLHVGLIIYAVLSTAAVIVVLLSYTKVERELAATRAVKRTLIETLETVSGDLTRTQRDLKEVIEAWGEVGTKHARRRLRAHLSSSLGRKYASVLASLETPQRRIEKPDSIEKGFLPSVSSAPGAHGNNSLTLRTEDGEIECELRPVDPTSTIPIMGRDCL